MGIGIGDDKVAEADKRSCLGGAALFEKAKPSKTDSVAKNEQQNLISGIAAAAGSKISKDIAFLLA